MKTKEELAEYKKQWQLKNKERLNKKSKDYYQLHKEEIKQKSNDYYFKNKQKISFQGKENYKNNREDLIQKSLDYVKNHKKETSDYQSKYRKEHDEELKEYFRIRNKRDRKKLNEQHCERKRIRWSVDVNYRLREVLSSRIRMALKNNWKITSTVQLVGCTLNNLKLHIESQFKPGMNWNNWGIGSDKWQIDHIRPCASFNLSKLKEQKICFHYTNLQPLWMRENLLKSDKILI
jgi:hypothetical protein